MNQPDYAGKILSVNTSFIKREKNLPKCFVEQSPLFVAFPGNSRFIQKEVEAIIRQG